MAHDLSLTSLRPTERFSQRVEHYVKYRPGYPEAVLACLREHCGLTANSVIADIGSGTGFLAELFLKNGNRVFGVEPNAEMRAAGEAFLKKYEGFTSMAGSAEATGLEDGSVDFVAAGQAFHWFDRSRARREFERILKPRGWVALVWNERVTTTPFLADYEQMLRHYSREYQQVDHRRISEDVVKEFFHPGRLRAFVLSNFQDFDLEALRGRLLSSSYVPLEGAPGHQEMMQATEKIFHDHARQGRVRFEYETRLYCGRFSGDR